MEYSDELLQKYMRLIHRLANKIDKNNVDDLVEVGKEAFIKAIKKYDSDRGAKFSTYLHMKVENAMKDEIRKTSWFKRAGKNEFKMEFFSDKKLNEELTVDAEELILNREKTATLKEVISQLPKPHSRIIKLMYWNGMTLIEVASYLKMSEGRVSQLHKEAVKMLEKKVKDER